MPQGPILLFTSVSSNDTALASSTFLFVKLAGFEILFIMLPTLYFKSFSELKYHEGRVLYFKQTQKTGMFFVGSHTTQ